MELTGCVFIDGENFRFSLKDLLSSTDFSKEHLPPRGRWPEFFEYLAKAAYVTTRIRTYWFVVGALDFSPYNIPDINKAPAKLERVLRKNDAFRKRIEDAPNKQDEIAALHKRLIATREEIEGRFRGWQRVHDGISMSCEAVEFRRAGSIRYDLFTGQFGSEKGVDVKLVVDLLERRPMFDVAIIVSGDGDYVPAVQVLKDSGKRVVNVSFKKRNGNLLPGGAYRLNLSTDKVIEVPFEHMEYFMGITDAKPAGLA